jgi:hypothetical protein
MFPYWSLSSLMALEEDRQRQLELLYWHHRTIGRARPARQRPHRFLSRSVVRASAFGRRRQDSVAVA